MYIYLSIYIYNIYIYIYIDIYIYIYIYTYIYIYIYIYILPSKKPYMQASVALPRLMRLPPPTALQLCRFPFRLCRLSGGGAAAPDGGDRGASLERNRPAQHLISSRCSAPDPEEPALIELRRTPTPANAQKSRAGSFRAPW